MQDTGEIRMITFCGNECMTSTSVYVSQGTIDWISFVHVFQDIDSEKPMMQVGQYVFAGEYEGKNQFQKKRHTCNMTVVKIPDFFSSF